MLKLRILRGVPASGKSTHAAELLGLGWTVVNRDDIRMSMFGKYYGVDESVVTQVEDAMIDSSLRAGKSTIVDATNLSNKFLKTKLSLASRHGAVVSYEDFPIPLQDAIERDRNREKTVGELVLIGMFRRYKINPEVGALKAPPASLPTFEPYVRPIGKPLAYIVDTDGTVADHEGVRSPYDTSKYHLDRPRPHVIQLVQGLRDTGVHIVGLSGRDAAFREVTTAWWSNNTIHPDAFFMRPAGDTRMDAIVKYELFKEHIEPNYNVLAAIDDRPQVLRMWKTIGLDVIDVGEGLEF